MARGPAHLPIQPGDPRGTGCLSTQQAQWTDKGPSGHGETAEKKNGKPGTIMVPYQGTSSLTVLPAAQLIQQHTSPSLTQSKPEIHHSSSSSTPPRHGNAHAPTTPIQHSILPIFTISNLRFKLYTILTRHRQPPRAFYTHYCNISITGCMYLSSWCDGLRASTTPELYQWGSLALLAGQTKLNRSVG